MRTLIALPPSKARESAVPHRFKQTRLFEQRLSHEAAILRRKNQDAPPGIARERLFRRAGQAETACNINGSHKPHECEIAVSERDLDRFLTEVEDCLMHVKLATNQIDKAAWAHLAEDWMELARASDELEIRV